MPGQRLSEHMILGDTLRVRNGWAFYCAESNCGCAIGGAMLSVGAWKLNQNYKGALADGRFQEWPWLQERAPGFANFSAEIGHLFREVCEGKTTLEALAAQVREWEDEFDDNLRLAQKEEVNEHASNINRGAARGIACADATTETDAASKRTEYAACAAYARGR